MGNGEWGMGNGEWGMGNGEWRMGNGEWGMGNGESRIENRESGIENPESELLILRMTTEIIFFSNVQKYGNNFFFFVAFSFNHVLNNF